MGYGPIGGYHNFKAGTFLLEPMRSITLAIDEVKFYNIVIINSFHRHAWIDTGKEITLPLLFNLNLF